MTTKDKVSWYTRATAAICFPEGDVRCGLCPLCETYARKQCRLTGEYLAEGYLRGGFCPLIIEEDNNGNSSSDSRRVRVR